MSSMNGNWCCTECNSTNAYQEEFRDDEIGEIYGCFDCGYYSVFRAEIDEDDEEGDTIEDYHGYEHEYREDDILEGRASQKNIETWNNYEKTGVRTMSRDMTEIIDDNCREEVGHSNWVILSTLSDQEKVGIETQGYFKTYQGVEVLFYWNDFENETE